MYDNPNKIDVLKRAMLHVNLFIICIDLILC